MTQATMTRAELEQEVRATEREQLVAQRYGRDDLAEQAAAKLAELAEIGLEMDHAESLLAQQVARMEHEFEHSGDIPADMAWRTPEIARQGLEANWDLDAEAWDLDPDDTATRDRVWDLIISEYFGAANA